MVIFMTGVYKEHVNRWLQAMLRTPLVKPLAKLNIVPLNEVPF